MSFAQEVHERGGRIARTAFVASSAKIEHPVDIADNATVYGGASVGAFTYVNVGSVLYAKSHVGRYCSIGRNVEIGLASHPIDFLSTHPFQVSETLFGRHPDYGSIVRKPWAFHRETVVGHDVWIGAKASVAGGVRVGDGSVIAAGAVVNHDVSPYTIVGGVPAKPVRPRFPEEVAQALLSLRWWDLPLAIIANLPFDDIHACIAALREIRQYEPSTRIEVRT